MEQNSELLQVFKNVLLMMYRRGYDVSEFEKIFSKDVEYFNKKYDLDEIEKHPNPTQKIMLKAPINKKDIRYMISYVFEKPGHKCLVFFAASEIGQKMKVDEISNLSSFLLQAKGITNIVIISISEMSKTTSDRLDLAADPYTITFFLDSELSYDPTKSKYNSTVDKIYTGKDASDFLLENKLTIRQMPKNSDEDIIAKYYELKPGSIVRYKRYNMIQGSIIDESYFYRAVIKKSLDKIKTRPKDKKLLLENEKIKENEE